MRKVIMFLMCTLGSISCVNLLERVDVSVSVVGDDNIGLAAAKVEFLNEDTSFFKNTDFDGNVDFQAVNKGVYKVSVSNAVGHHSITFDSLLIDDSGIIKVALKPFPLDRECVDIEWSGGWVTFEMEDGQFFSVKSSPVSIKKKE